MQKTKIEWANWVWNPIKGLCPVGCWYCYARRMYQRFRWNPEIRMGTWSDSPLVSICPASPCRIFVCSTFELFHPSVDKFRDDIFSVIKAHSIFKSDATFIILTKLPERIDRPMPDNVWLGVSVTNQDDADKRIPLLLQAEAKVRFVSIEPMLGPVSLVGGAYGPNWLEGWAVEPKHDSRCDGSCQRGLCPVPVQVQTPKIDWVIVGRLTGHGHKYDPPREWLDLIMLDCQMYKTPAFLKNNIQEMEYPQPKMFIQQFPNIA